MIEATPARCTRCGGDMWLLGVGNMPGAKPACKTCYKLWPGEFWIKPVDIWKES